MDSKFENGVFRYAVESALNHIIITDTDGKIIFANKSVEIITGFTHQEIIGNNPKLWGKQMDTVFYKKLWQTIKKDRKPFEGEIKNKRKNGQLYIAHAVISPILDDKNNLLGFIGTEEDITKEKEIDQMKTDFISFTAHQLKTPITAIKWSNERILEEKAKLKKSQLKYVKKVEDMSEKLIALIDLLLNITRIESGKINITLEATNLAKLIKNISTEVKQNFPDCKNKIRFVLKGNIQKIVTDSKLVGEVFKNLLTNAYRYSYEKTVIEIGAKKEKDTLLCWVKNQGIGIPKKEQNMIFTKYFRTSYAKEKQISGNGLGLYFVHLIVSSLSGKIWHKSIPRKTTTFYFSIPV